MSSETPELAETQEHAYKIGSAIQAVFDEHSPGMIFTLVVCNPESGSVVYVSNGDREFNIAMLKDWIARQEAKS